MPEPLPAAEWNDGKSDHTQWMVWRAVCRTWPCIFPSEMSQIFDPPVPQEEINRRWTIMNDTPVATNVAVLEEVGDDVPKVQMLNRADNTDAWLAISEILDNIIDNYRLHSKILTEGGNPTADLEVRILIMDPGNNDTIFIQIHENSGGIPQLALNAFVAPGVSEWGQVEAAVGVWGNGQKIGMAKLGRHNEISSNNGDNPAFTLRLGATEPADEDGGAGEAKKLPRNYYHPDNRWWRVQPVRTEEGTEPEVGNTISVFKKVPNHTFLELTTEVEWQNIISKLTTIFANKIREVTNKVRRNMEAAEIQFEEPPAISITLEHDFFGNTDIANPENEEIFGINQELRGDFEALQSTFCKIPGLGPQRISIKIGADQLADEYEHDIYLDALVGLLPEQAEGGDEGTRGITFWGNGKLFCKGHDATIGVPGGYSAWSHDQGGGAQNYWKCYIRIWSQNPLLIPWSVDTKWGYRDTSPAKDILKVIYHAICHPYWVASGHLQHLGGQLRRAAPLFCGWDDENLPVAEDKREYPEDMAGLEAILEWVHEMDEDMIKSMLARDFDEDSIEVVDDPPEAEEGPRVPLTWVSNNQFRVRVNALHQRLSPMWRTGILHNASNIPSQALGDDLNNPGPDKLHSRYMVLGMYPQAFLSSGEEE